MAGFNDLLSAANNVANNASNALDNLAGGNYSTGNTGIDDRNITTTSGFSNRDIIEYKGPVYGEIAIGINVVSDAFAKVSNALGTHSNSYKKVFEKSRKEAVEEVKKEAAQLGANGIVDLNVDYETIYTNQDSMVLVMAVGTAVVVN